MYDGDGRFSPFTNSLLSQSNCRRQQYFLPENLHISIHVTEDLQCTVSSFSSSYQLQHQNNFLDPSSHSPGLTNAPRSPRARLGKWEEAEKAGPQVPHIPSLLSLPTELYDNSIGAKHNRVYFSMLVYFGTVHIWNQCSSSVTSRSCLPGVRLNMENICHCQISFLSSNLSHKMPRELLPISPHDFFLHFPLQCATNPDISFQSDKHFPTANPTPTLPFSTHYSLSPSPFLLSFF